MSPAARRPRLPPVIGHRGAAAIAPENTLAGFRAARRAGARWVEFDVRLSRDGKGVVIHDATLERTTGRPAPVARTSLADIRACDAGSRFSPDFAGEAVPGLDETLSVLSTLGLGANIELKSCGRRNRALVAEVIEALARRRHAPPPVLISSFSPAMLRAVRGRDPHVPLGLLLKRRRRRDWRRLARALGCCSVHCAERGLSRDVVEGIRQAGFAVVVYTVNDPARARELRAWGVDALISDTPGALLAALADGVRCGKAAVQ